MGRLPFDPSRMLARNGGASPAESAKKNTSHITVAQLAGLIDRTLKDHLPTGLKVIGEVGRFTPRTHWYFDLKDAEAVISCVMWQSAARKAMFQPRAGQQVVVTGRIEFYAPQGRSQFIADKIEPVGEGALDLAFKALCEELKALGWFDDSRKRPLPLMPRKVAVVTSRTGAALQDVLDTFARRSPCVDIALVDVRVQGDGCASQVARAIRWLSREYERLGIDVILVTRGGGSLEDLWAFNERIVAEAIVESRIPVIAAIGHETDTTIAELVADVRGATPTQAAMRIAPESSAIARQLRSTGLRLASILDRQIRLDRERLRSATRHSAFADPMRIVDQKADELTGAARDIRHAADARLRSARARLDALALRLERYRPEFIYARRDSELRTLAEALRAVIIARLRPERLRILHHKMQSSIDCSVREHALRISGLARSLELVGPRSVLARGYSLTLDSDGAPIRSTVQAVPGATVRTRVLDGSFTSVVSGDAPVTAPLPPPRAAKPRRRLVLDVTPCLFGAPPDNTAAADQNAPAR
jgi:exodeoxyribonuclease VII large subunit